NDCGLTCRFWQSQALCRWLHRSDLKTTTAVKNAPGDASEFVGERNRQLEPIEPSRCSRDPRFKTVPLPALWVQQSGMCGLHEQHTRIAIAPFGDRRMQDPPSGLHLSRREMEPSAEASALGERTGVADRSNCCGLDDRAKARHGYEALGYVVLLGQ